jgi:PAS domain S-box-containing protein
MHAFDKPRYADELSLIEQLQEKFQSSDSCDKANIEYLDLLEAISAAVYTIDVAGRITFYNQAAVDLWGRYPALGTSEWCGSWRLFWPDGRPMAHDECPMAKALKEKRRIKGAEAIAQRPDGTFVPFLAYPTPLYDKAGELVGALNLLLDITGMKRIEHSGWLLDAVFESSEDAILSVSLDGIITSANQSVGPLFGYTSEELIGKPIVTLYPSNEYVDEREVIERIIQGERVKHYETTRRRKDGTLVDISLTVSPIKNSDGRVIGVSKIARDITERRRAHDQQLLFLKEMNHRIKNLFALTGSLIALSARSAKTVKDLDSALRSRLGALARAHELTLPVLTETEMKPPQLSSLADLISTVFAPYGSDFGNARIAAQGTDVQIGGKALTSIALLLHEFATNAAKYGALSEPTGRIDISWTTEEDALELIWAEHGGPSLEGAPENEGFGGLLARATVAGQLGGRLARDWTPEGLVIKLWAPLDRLYK